MPVLDPAGSTTGLGNGPMDSERRRPTPLEADHEPVSTVVTDHQPGPAPFPGNKPCRRAGHDLRCKFAYSRLDSIVGICCRCSKKAIGKVARERYRQDHEDWLTAQAKKPSAAGAIDTTTEVAWADDMREAILDHVMEMQLTC